MSITIAVHAGRGLERGVADVARLLAEDGPQEPLLGGEVGLALGGDLPHQDVAGRGRGAPMRMIPSSSRFFTASSPTLGISLGDLLHAPVGVPDLELELLDVDRGEHDRRLIEASR